MEEKLQIAEMFVCIGEISDSNPDSPDLGLLYLQQLPTATAYSGGKVRTGANKSPTCPPLHPNLQYAWPERSETAAALET